MPKYRIKSEKITGIVAETTEPGASAVKVWTKIRFITSDDPFFYIAITGLTNIFINKIGGVFNSDIVSRFLILLHEDNNADIYINDFPEAQMVKVNRSVAKGEAIYSKDITDIAEVNFPGIEIKKTDAIVYCTKINWKFGLYFDFTRDLDIKILYEDLGKLAKALNFQKFLADTEQELSLARQKGNIDAFIITEGKTDWIHLEAAQKKLNIVLNIAFDKYEENRSDSDTLEMCKHFSRLPNSTKKIFVFDRDNPLIKKELDKKTEKGKNYQNWGNNVFSIYLPIPTHRNSYKNISIEFFYTDDEIHTRDHTTGKQLFFNNEIAKIVKNVGGKSTISYEKLDKPNLEMEYDKKIYCEDADKIVDSSGKGVALSKTIFASKILNDEPPFNNFNFSELKSIFDIIQHIIETEKEEVA